MGSFPYNSELDKRRRYSKLFRRAVRKIHFVLLGWVLGLSLFIFSSVWSGNSYAEEIVELRTEFQNTPPKYIQDADGSFSGLCVELLHLIEQQSKYRFKYPKEFVPQKRIHKNLEIGFTDVHFGLARNTVRERIYNFGEPVYTVKNMLAVRADDPIQVKSFEDIRDLGSEGVILTPMGTASYRYLDEQGGLLIDDGGKTPAQNLEKLRINRGRFFFYTDLNLLYEVNRSANKGKFRVVSAVFREYDHWFVFSKAVDDAIVKDISAIIRSIKSTREYQEIVDRYMKIE